MGAEALLDTHAKDLQALTFRLSPPAWPRRLIGWAIDEHLRTDLVESALSMAVAMPGELAEAIYPGRRPRLSVHIRARWRGSRTGTTWPARSAALVCAGIVLRPNHSGQTMKVEF